MERGVAIDRLPTTYAAVLRLVDAGATVDEIADAFATTVDAVPTLVAIGEQKLAVILATV